MSFCDALTRRVIEQAVRRWMPIAEVRFRSQTNACDGLWWTKYLRDSVSEVRRGFPVTFITPMSHIHSLAYHQCCIILACEIVV